MASYTQSSVTEEPFLTTLSLGALRRRGILWSAQKKKRYEVTNCIGKKKLARYFYQLREQSPSSKTALTKNDSLAHRYGEVLPS